MKQNTCKHCGSHDHLSMRCFKAPKRTYKLSVVNKKPVRVAVKAKRSISRKLVVKKLDAVFSKYIRLRDQGKGCITCGKQQPWQEQQNCHFFSRGRYATRWDENNCFAGCVTCNVFLKGNYIQYTLKIVDMFGRTFVDELEKKSLKTVKIPTVVLLEMIDDYSKRVEKLQKT